MRPRQTDRDLSDTRTRVGALPQTGYYVVVSRDFVADHPDMSTVMCASVYGEVLGLRTEVVVGIEDGVPRESAIRCDFVMLMFKAKLTGFVATLSAARHAELQRALAHALQLDTSS